MWEVRKDVTVGWMENSRKQPEAKLAKIGYHTRWIWSPLSRQLRDLWQRCRLLHLFVLKHSFESLCRSFGSWKESRFHAFITLYQLASEMLAIFIIQNVLPPENTSLLSHLDCKGFTIASTLYQAKKEMAKLTGKAQRVIGKGERFKVGVTHMMVHNVLWCNIVTTKSQHDLL